MSEFINNHSKRQEMLKQLIRRLHDGASVDEVKADFAQLVQSVGAGEIAEMEQALINEGLPESEVKRLCDVHVTVFKESLDQQPAPEDLPGHPVHTFRAENAAAEKTLDKLHDTLEELQLRPGMDGLRTAQKELHDLRQFEKHYIRKENILFPYLEQHGFSGPSKVMWAIHDDIRDGWKKLGELLNTRPASMSEFGAQADAAFQSVNTAMRDMFYKEEHILFPAALERLSDEEWAAIRAQEDEVGFYHVQPGSDWPPTALAEKVKGRRAPQSEYAHPLEAGAHSATPPAGRIPLDVGELTAEQIDLLLTHLPVDVTFVDENDEVRYYSGTNERIFPRSPAIIGRKVQNCHPPASVHRVQEILDAFRAGTRDHAEFWIQMQGRFIHITYHAMRDATGSYRGTLEVTQDIGPLRKLEGEKRLLDQE